MRSAGSELTSSVSSLDGTVISPSSSICAPIHRLIAISRFVAASLSRPSSVESLTFWVIGNVVRLAAARPTTPSAGLRFS